MTPSSPTRRSSDLPGDVGYHAAKAGIVGLTRATAIDTAAAGITVNAVAPGWIDTASASAYERRLGAATPVGRSGTADEVAHAIVFLASEGASYITGQLITVDGANSISEERGDRKSVVSGKRVSVRVDLGGRRIIKTKKTNEPKNQK